jgi:hypothetical protein
VQVLPATGAAKLRRVPVTFSHIDRFDGTVVFALTDG